MILSSLKEENLCLLSIRMILQLVLPWGSKRTSLLEENNIKVNGNGARKPIIQKNRSGRVVTQKSDTVYMGMLISG